MWNSVLCAAGTSTHTRHICPSISTWTKQNLALPVQIQHKPKRVVWYGSYSATDWPKPLQPPRLPKILLLNPNCEIGSWPSAKSTSWLGRKKPPSRHWEMATLLPFYRNIFQDTPSFQIFITCHKIIHTHIHTQRYILKKGSGWEELQNIKNFYKWYTGICIDFYLEVRVDS